MTNDVPHKNILICGKTLTKIVNVEKIKTSGHGRKRYDELIPHPRW